MNSIQTNSFEELRPDRPKQLYESVLLSILKNSKSKCCLNRPNVSDRFLKIFWMSLYQLQSRMILLSSFRDNQYDIHYRHC